MESVDRSENWRWREGPREPGRPSSSTSTVCWPTRPDASTTRLGDWKSFFDSCGDDPIIEEIERLLELLDSSLKVVLLTGRPRRVQPHTVAWLERYGLRWDLLIMREYGDYSGVDEFKRGALRELVNEGFDIRLALDDDPKNHAMYVSEGVPCIYIHSGYYL